MKKENKKGFTLVELVIVIAVIAILAAVLIPTFSGIIEKAKKSSAMQAARNAYTEYLIDNAEEMSGTEDFVIISGNYAFLANDGQFESTAIDYKTTATSSINTDVTFASNELDVQGIKYSVYPTSGTVTAGNYYQSCENGIYQLVVVTE